MEVWDVDTGKLLRTSKKFPFSDDLNIVLSPDGKLLFKPEDKMLRVFSTDTTEEVGKLSANVSEAFRSIQFVPNTKKVLGISGNTVQVWDISDLASGIPDAPEHK